MQTRSQRRRHQLERTTAFTHTVSCRISAEITDWIIDFLHSDPEALQACSLVCKAWLPSTRFHLFGFLCLQSRDIMDFFEDTKYMDPLVLTNIRNLALGRFKGLDAWAPTGIVWEGIGRLPSLQSLTFCRIDITHLLLSTPKLIAPDTPSLKHLRLHRVRGRNNAINDLFPIICMFPHLETLQMIGWRSRTLKEPNTERFPQTLRSLTALSRYSTGIVKWLCLHDPIPPISTLNLCVDVLSLGQLMNMLAETLQCLTLTHGTLMDTDPWRSFKLYNSRCLQSLHIRNYPRHCPHLQSILLLLTQIQSSRFQSFILMVAVDELSDVPWDSFMDALKPFSDSLKAVEFNLWGPFLIKEGQEAELQAIRVKCSQFLDCVTVTLLSPERKPDLMEMLDNFGNFYGS